MFNLTYFNDKFNQINFITNLSQVTFLGLPLSNIIFALILFVFVVVLGKIVAKLVDFYLVSYYKKKHQEFVLANPSYAHNIRKFSSEIQPAVVNLFIVLSVKITMDHLNLMVFPIDLLVNSIVILFGFIALAKIAQFFIETVGANIVKRTESSLDDALLPIVHKLTYVFFIIWGLVMLLRLWKVDISPILGGLGLLGLAVSLAMQDTLKNLFGAISLLTDETFKIGDRIFIKEQGVEGTVLDIGLRSTEILTYDNEIILVPNGVLVNSTIKNFLLPTPRARCIVEFEVAYGTDVDKVKKIILDSVNKLDFVLDDPKADVIFTTMSAYSLKFQARFWVGDVTQSYDSKLKVIDGIYKDLNKNKIEIPFPIQKVILEK